MYKGKFDQKSKQTSTDVQELLAQRSRTPAPQPEKPKKPAPPRDPGAMKSAPKQPSQSGAGTQAKPKAPPAKPQTPQKAVSQPQKRGPRLGGLIFYTIYFMYILVFFAATFIGMIWLKGWLTDYEQAQSTTKAKMVFEQLFTDPQWGDIYDASGAQSSQYEGRDQFVAYMTEKVGNQPLTYLKTSAGLSGGEKYAIRLGDETIASFTLVDKNESEGTGLESVTKLPDWQLSSVEIVMDQGESYRVVTMNGHSAYVNNVPLEDSHIIQVASTRAEDYLPEGTTGVSTCTLEIGGLIAPPTVTVFDAQGNQMEVTYDEATRTFTERTESNTIEPELQEQALNAARSYSRWMIEDLTDRGTFAKYFDPSSEIYRATVALGHYDLFMQANNGFEFVDESVTDYCRYTDDLFSCRVSVTTNVKRTDNTVKPYEFEKSMFFRKNESGRWLCFEATNVDVSQPVGKVRLTFMYGETELTSDLYQTDASEIITPTITPVPEGKVFSGWATLSTDEAGQTVYNVVFQPDESGRVSLPESTSLTPMTLYAVFENAGAAAPASEPTEGA